MSIEFKSMSIEEVSEYIHAAGLPKFRAIQLLSWVYQKGVAGYDLMTNLPKTMREQFEIEFPLFIPKIVDLQISRDESRKYLVEFHDGARAEMVGLPSDDGRLTVCVSSQAGCAMNCAFCATGKAGLTRSLFPGEIVDQILIVQDDFGRHVTNVVVMGQGEPFANYDNVLAALRIINHPKLLNIGARHITVSTCGIITGIDRFAAEPEQFTLAISLHTAIQEKRNELMPSMKNYDLMRLRQALKDYANQSGRRFSFEYALMADVNDSDEDLKALTTYCKGLLCHVNLIPLNEIEDSPFKPVSKQTMQHWCDRLEKDGIAASIRKSRGADIAAACGQLAYRRRNG